jgi:large subunit ribosomal protein L1
VPVGKISFENQKLLDNLMAIIDSVIKAKPSGAKGQYIKTASVATTIGPGIKLDLRSVGSGAAS